MIFLREIKTEPLFMSSENVEDYEMHESGFGTVVIDKNGFVHHVMESLEEVQKAFKNNINMGIKFESKGIVIGDYIIPRTIQIEIPNNVPSKVKPIVIFPLVGLDEISVKVNQHKGIFGGTTFEGVLSPNASHVINLNTGVE